VDIYSFFYYILSMKLYTKRHVILAAAASAFLGLAVAGIFIFIYGIHCKSSAHGKTEAEYVMHNSFLENDTASSEQTDTLTDSFVLQTSEPAEKPVRNTSDKSTLYTQDELQNISVYERCNEAVVNINTQVMAVNWFLEPVPQNGGSGSGSRVPTDSWAPEGAGLPESVLGSVPLSLVGAGAGLSEGSGSGAWGARALGVGLCPGPGRSSGEDMASSCSPGRDESRAEAAPVASAEAGGRPLRLFPSATPLDPSLYEERARSGG